MIDVTKIELNPLPPSVIKMKNDIKVLNEENINLSVCVFIILVASSIVISYQVYQNYKNENYKN